jgi:hypothetical protein
MISRIELEKCFTCKNNHWQLFLNRFILILFFTASIVLFLNSILCRLAFLIYVGCCTSVSNVPIYIDFSPTSTLHILPRHHNHIGMRAIIGQHRDRQTHTECIKIKGKVIYKGNSLSHLTSLSSFSIFLQKDIQ